MKDYALWNRLINRPGSDYILRTAMWRAACGVSSMAGHPINNHRFQVQNVPIGEVVDHAGAGPEDDMVGIYLLIGGGLGGQAILILPLDNALKLVDQLMGQPQGTSSELGELERSALAEIGNLAVSRFLNAVAVHTGWSDILRPSPPGVMVDMLGAILDVVITQVATIRDDLLVIETTLDDFEDMIHARFWVLPDPAVEATAELVA
jgi:chemotaxis protein CheC